MSQEQKSAVEEWREANDEARVAENRLAKAWDEYEKHRIPVDPAIIYVYDPQAGQLVKIATAAKRS